MTSRRGQWSSSRGGGAAVLEGMRRSRAQLAADGRLVKNTYTYEGMLNFFFCVGDSASSDFFSQPCCVEDHPLESDPMRSRVKVEQGLVLSTTNCNGVNAASLFEEAIQLDPTNLEAYYNLGVLLQRENRLAEAISAYTRVLFLDPYHLPALYNAGIINFETKNYPVSLSYFKQVVSVKATVSDQTLLINAYVNIGVVSLELEEDSQAISAFQQALSLDPRCCPALINLARAHKTLNTKDDSQKSELYYRKVLEIEPSNEEATSFLNQ